MAITNVLSFGDRCKYMLKCYGLGSVLRHMREIAAYLGSYLVHKD
jgi:hypothetical protein